MRATRSKSVPARLRVLFAREADIAEIIRQGPKSRYHLIRWCMDSDRIEFGQWFNGRVFPERADLSPNGKLLVCFAGKPRPGEPDRQYWTAISRPPYFTALALWFQGEITASSGTFISDRALAGVPHRNPDIGHLPDDFMIDRTQRKGPHNKLRQQLNGWETDSDCPHPSDWPDTLRAWGRRAQPRGEAVLWTAKTRDPGDRSWTWCHVITYGANDRPFLLLDVDWADWDQRGRLISVHKGRLFARSPEHLNGESRLLADLNETPKETFPAPDWAREWPKR